MNINIAARNPNCFRRIWHPWYKSINGTYPSGLAVISYSDKMLFLGSLLASAEKTLTLSSLKKKVSFLPLRLELWLENTITITTHITMTAPAGRVVHKKYYYSEHIEYCNCTCKGRKNEEIAMEYWKTTYSLYTCTTCAFL